MATDWKLKSEHSPLLMKEDETSFNDSINSKFYQYKQDVYIQEEFINFYGTQLQTRYIQCVVHNKVNEHHPTTPPHPKTSHLIV